MGSEVVPKIPGEGHQVNNGIGSAGVHNGDGPRKRVKLHGRAFYESIGSPKLVLAPMVEQSEFVRLHLSIPFLLIFFYPPKPLC
jgi:tRNA-dihydrouridine synthase 1